MDDFITRIKWLGRMSEDNDFTYSVIPLNDIFWLIHFQNDGLSNYELYDMKTDKYLTHSNNFFEVIDYINRNK